MNENYDEDLEYQRAAEERRKRRQQRRRHERNMKIAFFAGIAVVILAAAFLIYYFFAGIAVVILAAAFLIYYFAGNKNGSLFSGLTGNGPSTATSSTGTIQQQTEAPIQVITEAETEAAETPSAAEAMAQTEAQTDEPSEDAGTEVLLEQAKQMAMGYDYDGAIELLKTIPGYEADSAVTAAISDFEKSKEACVPVDVTTVSHIFYHSLVNDPASAFNVAVLGQSAVDGMNAWMTTVEEFDKITQAMYDNGYVFVRLRDLVVETTDENGNVHFAPNTNLLLPPDKKALVLSVDDLSYYHSYEAASFPDKLVLDENGKVKCHYVKPDGSEEVGDFDVVPRLNSFLEEHPDGAYKGARGMIALTGYNGILGYRTDIDYKVKENLMSDQAKWLEEHPEFDWDADVAEATKIADALKEEGWEFASHTWGHLSVTSKTAEQLKVDNEKWVNTVQNIVGPVDTIIFAHGNDLGSWEGYTDDNEKYRYYKDAGYNFFCNVDSLNPYWVQITDNYVRQGRIDLDGYQLYQASIGATTVLDGFFTASEVFDYRRPTPVVANGES